MAFGQIIKRLRSGAGMTQERLADLLNISPQAVSRWENDAAMPDISLLRPLANLFGVTTDYLLEMDSFQKDARREEFEEAFRDYWKKEDKEKNYKIALRAAAEYPGDMAYLEWLASAEFYMAFLQPDDDGDVKYHELLDSSIRHYSIVLENAAEEKLRRSARSGIVLALHHSGKLSEAKEYALGEEDERKRDELLTWCLEGAEKDRHNQKLAEKKLNDFILQLTYATPSIEVCDMIEKVLEDVFPDGNYLYYANILQYNSIRKASILCSHGSEAEALAELQKARVHAETMTRLGKESKYRFTGPLFDLLEEEKPLSDGPQTDVDDFIDVCKKRKCFDPLRDREDFKALLRK